MNAQQLETFARAIVVEALLVEGEDDDLQFSVSLHDPETSRDTHALFFDRFEESFGLCEVVYLDEGDPVNIDGEPLVELAPIATFNTAEEAAAVLVDLAIENGCLPRLDPMQFDDP